MSGLKACRGFKWTTVLADGNRSSNFRVGNCEWYLAIKDQFDPNMTVYHEVLICPKQIQDTPFRPFKLRCFYEHITSSRQSQLRLKLIESPTNHLLWKFAKNVMLSNFEEIMFVFFFDEDIPLELRTESGEEPPVSDLSSLSSDLGALLASGDFSDVKLKTESGIKSAHRSVLACRSEVFSAMFRSEMKESRSGLVEIRDLDLDETVFDLFLEYLYAGKIPGDLDDNTIIRLYSAADKYAVHSLKKQCGDVMSRCMTRENHQALLVLADVHSDERLKGIVIESIVEKPDWLNCEGWHQFSKQHQALANEVFLKLFKKTFKK